MAGLLAKDLILIKKRKLFFLIMLMIGYMLGVMGGNDFVVGYITFLGSMYAFSTLSYDDVDNGLSFLMTMPVNSRMYVIEKLIFIFFQTVIHWIIGFAFLLLGSYYRGVEIGSLGGYILIIPVAMLMIAFCMPVQIKFGAEKSRVIMILFLGLAFVAVSIMDKYFYGIINMEAINSMSDSLLAGIVYAVTIIGLIISGIVSVHILDNKEY